MARGRLGIKRFRERARNAGTLAGALLRSRGAEAGAGGERAGLQHFPTRPFDHHAAAYALPAWLDVREPWVAALRDLYALPVSWPTSLSPEAGLFLHSLVLNTSPRVIVETGTFVSISTHWMGAALSALGGDRAVHCFDLFDGGAWALRWGERGATPPATQRSLIESSLDRAGLARLVHLHEGDSATALASLASALQPSGVQLAFIDGDHSEAGVVRDLAAVEPLLDRGGYIVLHDIYPDQCAHRGPRFLIDQLHTIARGRYECCEIYTTPWNYGMAVLRRLA